jgi:hypothetical protein
MPDKALLCKHCLKGGLKNTLRIGGLMSIMPEK